MDIRKLGEAILHKWKVDLKSKNRAKANISGNFDELIDGWNSSEIPRDVAEDLMKDAVKEHFPSRSLARSFYKRNKAMLQGATEDEYTANWCNMIECEAYQVFYLYYPIEVKKKEKVSYGSMSKQEYLRQMSYANTHPDINLNKVLEKRALTMKEDKDYDEASVQVNLENL